MSADLPTSVPRYLTAGDTWAWRIALDDYPASAGWTLTYALVTATTRIAITASADGDAHLVSVAAATTAAYAAGDYAWQAYVSDGTDRAMVASGTVTVRPNLAAAATGYDVRSPAAKALAAIEAYLAAGDLEAAEVQFEGRAIKFYALKDLYDIRSKLRSEVANEAAAAKAAELGIDPRRYRIRLGVE